MGLAQEQVAELEAYYQRRMDVGCTSGGIVAGFATEYHAGLALLAERQELTQERDEARREVEGLRHALAAEAVQKQELVANLEESRQRYGELAQQHRQEAMDAQERWFKAERELERLREASRWFLQEVSEFDHVASERAGAAPDINAFCHARDTLERLAGQGEPKRGDLSELAAIGKLAIRIYDCECEFEDLPHGQEKARAASYCNEWRDALDSAIAAYKVSRMSPEGK